MKAKPYGMLASFTSEDAFIAALGTLGSAGRTKVETFTPYGVEREEGVLPWRRSPVGPVMLAAGMIGGAGAFFMQWYAAREYWLNVGGRPVDSWPSFIPVTFELTVLSAALSGVACMLWLAGLPRLDHPVFSDPRFQRASQDRFFICLRADSPGYTRAGAREAMLKANAETAEEVWG